MQEGIRRSNLRSDKNQISGTQGVVDYYLALDMSFATFDKDDILMQLQVLARTGCSGSQKKRSDSSERFFVIVIYLIRTSKLLQTGSYP